MAIATTIVGESAAASKPDRLGRLSSAAYSGCINIAFAVNIPAIVRARMEYAFRVFAAIYNYRVLDSGCLEGSITYRYGEGTDGGDAAILIPARYSASGGKTPGLPEKVRYADEDFFLFHGLDPQTGRPDWLGEIFEWLSSSHERQVTKRDTTGRIPDSEMIFDHIGLPTWKPQAALLMAWLQQVSQYGDKEQGLVRAPSVVSGVEHLVVCSHDIDFYFTDRKAAALRLLKNLVIACLLYKSRSYFASNLTMLLKLAAGKKVGRYLPALIEKLEEQGIRSTLFVVAHRGHRRDPDYKLAKLANELSESIKRGFPVEIHGSYKSVLENRSLQPEKRALEDVIAKQPLGNRQHWLRFGDPEVLFRTVSEVGLVFDSSLGFSDTVGFRGGACFAFPPYDFHYERPHNFLEIPLVIMDGSLIECSRKSGESAQVLADRILSQSRKLGWGGISVLWHNPLEALSVPDEINDVFWRCAEQRDKFREQWVSSDEFLALSLPRYHRAGLLSRHRGATSNARGGSADLPGRINFHTQ